jgi:DNA-binding NtrC family response regulator
VELSHGGINSITSTATHWLNKAKYDLVIIDVNLPDGSGFEILSEIKDECPVIVFSGQDKVAAVRQEIAAYLSKGTTSNEKLLTTIRRVIKQAKRDK